jgi:hypothetical protein
MMALAGRILQKNTGRSDNTMAGTSRPGDREVISEARDGVEVQEEYFHSRQELHRILRELGFDARQEDRVVPFERRRSPAKS